MKRFIKQLFRFALIGHIPLLILVILYLVKDPFKVIYKYDQLYDSKSKGWVGLNKDFVSTTTFIKNYDTYKYNSFIFGNSRSIFYQIDQWKKYLSPNSNCFHYDASNEALYAIDKKLSFLDKKGVDIKNAMLVIDYSTIAQYKPKSGHLFIITPVLVNNKNILKFHLTFFLAYMSPKFLYAYFDFLISGEVKPYMREKNLLDNRPRNYSDITNELKYDFFEDQINKGEYYSPERMKLFLKRDTIQTYSPIAIYENQKILFQNIKSIFLKHQTNYKIVISPLYNQHKLNPVDLKYMQELFGKNNVYDFSGVNEMTADYRNYYEPSHYRPHIANQVMREVYSRSK